jgi:hypothetical protein
MSIDTLETLVSFSVTATVAVPGVRNGVQRVEVQREQEQPAVTVRSVLERNRDVLVEAGHAVFDDDRLVDLADGISVSVNGRPASLDDTLDPSDPNAIPLVIVAPRVANG